MALSEIDSGICGYCAIVQTKSEGRAVRVQIESPCPHVQALAKELVSVEPFGEISFRGDGPLTLRLAARHLAHPACPVPAGIIKTIEVEAGLALPKEATIRPAKD